MLRPARPARALSAAAASAAVAAALLVVPAHAAPSPSGVTAVRVVTPPTEVDRAALVRLMRNAGKATDRGLITGARVRTSLHLGGLTLTTTGRTRDGKAAMRIEGGPVMLSDYVAGRAYLPIAVVAEGVGVEPDVLAAALASLGKPGATWAVSDARGQDPVPVAGTDLVRSARAASTWTWKRAHGITTWRLGESRQDVRITTAVALDKRQRIVRESLVLSTRSRGRGAEQSLRVRYAGVAPIMLPTEAQSVDLDELLKALASTAGAPVAPVLVDAAQAQVAALRSMSGH